jgi:hypothetical protein
MVLKCGPSKVRKSGKKGPFQLTAKTTPLLPTYSRTNVPDDKVVSLML